MNVTTLLKEKQQLIEKGRKLLENKIFPDEILTNIKDDSLRKDVSKEIFTPNNVRFDDLSSEEKQKRKESLKVQLAYHSHLQSFANFKGITYFLLIVGLITLITAILRINQNLYFGLITTLIGGVLLFISLDYKKIVSYSLKIAIAYAVLYLIELAVFQIPSPYIQAIGSDVLSSRRGGLTKIINLISPYVYVTLRVCLGVFLFQIYTTQKKFLQEKQRFEQRH